MKRLVAALALLLALVPASAAAQSEPAPRASLPDIEDEVMCTVCGTTLQLSSSPQATQEREFINDLIAEGRTKDEIKDALVVEYGADVLAVPEKSGFALAAWIIPAAAFLIALVAITAMARRWRAQRPAPAASSTGPATGLDAGEVERLRADLKRYEP